MLANKGQFDPTPFDLTEEGVMTDQPARSLNACLAYRQCKIDVVAERER